MVTTLEQEPQTTTATASPARTRNGETEHQPEDSGKRIIAARFNIGRHMLERALASAAPNERTAMERFWKYCQARNLDRSRLGKLLKKQGGEFYAADSIYQTLTGHRGKQGTDIGPICRAMEEFLADVEPQSGSGGAFIVTDFAESIWSYCDRAMRLHAMGFIFGDNGLGKTDATIELCTNRENSHKRQYLRMPTRGHLNHFLQVCARGQGLGDRQTTANLRHNVMEAFPEQVVIDEMDQCFQSIRNGWGLATLDFMREAYDYRRQKGRPISFVFIGDAEAQAKFNTGDTARRLKRLWRRRIPRLQLPDMLSRADRNKFSRAIGLPAAPAAMVSVRDSGTGKTFTDSPLKIEKEVIAEHGLGYWKLILDDAAENAREQRRTITWGAVLKSYCVFQSEEELSPSANDGDDEEGE